MMSDDPLHVSRTTHGGTHSPLHCKAVSHALHHDDGVETWELATLHGASFWPGDEILCKAWARMGKRSMVVQRWDQRLGDQTSRAEGSVNNALM